MSSRSIVLVIAAAGALALVLWLGMAAGDRRPTPERTKASSSEPSAAAQPAENAIDEPAGVSLATAVAAAAAEPVSVAAPERVEVEEAELAGARWVEGRVIFPPNTPADESVCVVARGRKLASGREHACPVGPDGMFRVAFAEKTRKGTIALEARYLYLEDGPLRVELDELTTPLVLEPELGGWIEGRIVVPADSGVTEESLAGTSVRLVDRARFRETRGRTTDVSLDGPRFTLTGQRPGSRYNLELDSEIVFARRILDVEVRAGKRTDAEFVVQKGVSVSGRIVDERGAPLGEVSVNAYSFDSSTAEPASFLGRFPITTRTDGTFHFRGLAPGRISVEADGPGMQDAELELEANEPGLVLEGIELVLAHHLSISGTVYWPDGRPAKASIEVLGDHAELPEILWTGADGAFTAEGIATGTYRLQARATETFETIEMGTETKQRRRWLAEAEGVSAGTAGIVLTLQPGLSVFGTVRDDLGMPVDSFQIEARPADPRLLLSGSPQRLVASSRPELVEFFRNAGGTFELSGFLPGAWSVAAHAPGHGASEPIKVELSAASATVELVVPRVGRIEGIVVDPSGQRVAHAEVSLQEGQVAYAWSFDETKNELTDENGRFAFENVDPGSVHLRATAEAAASSELLSLTLEPGGLLADVELRLARGPIEGTDEREDG